MPLEPELERAITEVVEKRDQPTRVAKGLIAWLEEMSNSELGRDDQIRNFDILCDAIVLSEATNAD